MVFCLVWSEIVPSFIINGSGTGQYDRCMGSISSCGQSHFRPTVLRVLQYAFTCASTFVEASVGVLISYWYVKHYLVLFIEEEDDDFLTLH